MLTQRTMYQRLMRGGLTSKDHHYHLLGLLGRGHSLVFQARHLDDAGFVAVKVLTPEYASAREYVTAFQEGGDLLARFTHPHIVRLIEAGQDDGLHYLVLEYVDGMPLREVIVGEGPLSLERALAIASQAADALNAVYKQGLIHGDLCPNHLLITAHDTVKLIDFGAWRLTLTTPAGWIPAVKGPYFLAPEQAEDPRNADIRSDLYSLACIVFQMLTGILPYDGDRVMEIINQHRHAPIPSACALRPALPLAIDHFFQQALAKAPGDRFPTPQAFLSGLPAATDQAL